MGTTKSKERTGAVWLCFLLIWAGLTLTLYSLNPGKPADSLLIETWDLDKGFPGTSLIQIARSPDGYLWFNTREYLVRYDGLTFQARDMGTRTGKDHNWISGLLTDSGGTMWVGTSRGIVHYRNGDFTLFIKWPPGKNLMSDFINKIYQDRSGNVWIGTGSRLYRVENHTLVPVPGTGSATKRIRSIVDDHAGSLLVGTATGLFRIIGDKLVPVTLPAPVKGASINDLLLDNRSRLWIGTERGLLLAQGDRFTRFTAADGLYDDIILDLAEDSHGSLWVGTERGLNRIKYARSGKLEVEKTAARAIISDIMEDNEHSLWIGTMGHHLKRLRNTSFKGYSENEGLPYYSNAILERRDKTLIASSAIGEVFRFKNGRFELFFAAGHSPDAGIRCLYEEPGGAIWGGCSRGGLTGSGSGLPF